MRPIYQRLGIVPREELPVEENPLEEATEG
jgi:hypothetical protein